LQKVTISFVMSVRIQQLGSHWKDFDEILYMSFFFRISIKKIQISSKSDKKNGYFTSRREYIYDNV
jgi:hypothetical protein